MNTEIETWEIILKAITVLIGVLGFTYQIIGFDPQKRRRLKIDLEILQKLKEAGLTEEHNRVVEHISARIPSIYREPKETDTVIRIPDLQRLIIGIALTLFFSGTAVFYYFDSGGFQWWMVINFLFIISGLGNILQGMNGDNTEKKNHTKINK